MSWIEVIDEHVIYDNPMPHLRSRHGYFPGVVELPSGELLALFTIAEAFEAVDMTTYVSRSSDGGKTWALQGPLYDSSVVGFPTSDNIKATLLSDGTLIASGYRYHRRNPDEAMGNPETNGTQPGDDIVSFSSDQGHTWTVPMVIPRKWPEMIEVSGPCIETRSGDILAAGALMTMWDGTSPSGHRGVVLRSPDKGCTWDDQGVSYFTTPDNSVSPYETRICEMQDGRIVAIVWAYDHVKDANMNNHVVVSHDSGRTWSSPMDTGVAAQASNLMWVGGDKLLTIHSHRAGETGLCVRLVDFAGDEWQAVKEQWIWTGVRQSVDTSHGLEALFVSLKFGQPSLLRVSNGDILATHWAVENGQGRILSHRLRMG